MAGLSGIVCVSVCSDFKNSVSSHGASASATHAQPDIPPIGINAVQLYRAYAENEVAADEQYKGKPILIDGFVDAIDKDFTNGIVVRLKSGAQFSPVMANVKSSSATSAAALKKRQRVEMLCRGDVRIVDSPTLSECAITATWQ